MTVAFCLLFIYIVINVYICCIHIVKYTQIYSTSESEMPIGCSI